MPRFLSNNDSSSTGIKGTNISVSDVLDQLGAPDDSQDDGQGRQSDNKDDKGSNREPDKTGNEEEAKDIESLDEEDLELSGDDEPSGEEEIEIDSPPRLKEIEKLAPGLLKKLPYLEKMIFRDRQYNQLFGGYDDAVEAHEKAGILDGFEKDLMAGSAKNLFSEIRQGDEKAFRKLANNLLPALFEVDQQAHNEVVTNIAKRMIIRMVNVGKSQNNEQLLDAATLLSQVIFGDTNFTPPTDDVSNKGNQKDDELENERRSFNQERLDAASQDVISRVTNTLKNTITQYIDPKNEMSAFVKRHAVDEALKAVDSAIDADDAFRKQMDRLWDAAIRAKLNRSSVDKIRTTYLGRAKSELKSAILKARADALKDNVRRDNGDNENAGNRQTNRRGPVTTGRSAPSNRGNRGAKLERRPGESVLDFLSRDD